VPSADGQWLSDESVVACENELKKAGIISLLKVGDVVWDIAVGDEGNFGESLLSVKCSPRDLLSLVGRMVWDGTYLIVSNTSLVTWTHLLIILG